MLIKIHYDILSHALYYILRNFRLREAFLFLIIMTLGLSYELASTESMLNTY